MTYSSSFLYMIKGGGIFKRKKEGWIKHFQLYDVLYEKKVLIDSSADDDDAGTAAVSTRGCYIPPPPLSAALFHGWLRFICHPSLSLLCIQNDVPWERKTISDFMISWWWNWGENDDDVNMIFFPFRNRVFGKFYITIVLVLYGDCKVWN